jgi:3D (Asp-Asp-Asp) domain-containing protein
MNDKTINRLFVIAILIVMLGSAILCWYNWPTKSIDSVPVQTETQVTVEATVPTTQKTTEPTITETTVITEPIVTTEPTEEEVYPSEWFVTDEKPSQFGDETYPPFESESDEEKIALGEYQLTAYCPCSYCCGKSDGITATGTIATAGRTIAVDPRVIPYGSRVMINGNVYIAEDCGGAIKNNRIDIFFDSHSEALQFGVQRAQVYLLK